MNKNEIEEKCNKELLRMEIIIGIITIIPFMVITLIVSFAKMEFIAQITLIITAIIVFMIGIIYMIKLERTAGYYECHNCRHKYVPALLSFLLSMHYGRTRYLKCPECNSKSWNKKVLTK